MKRFDRLLVIIPVLILLTIAAADAALTRKKDTARQYLVDANRIEQSIMRGETPSPDDFPSVTAITAYDGSSAFYSSGSEYLIREINGTIYRIDYEDTHDEKNNKSIVIINCTLLALLAVIMTVLIYIRQNVLRQFTHLRDVPYQLAKGNLSEPLKENKSRYFGKFVWGLDMLRGELERSKTTGLERVRKEKTLLLSLSHDIKTPLAAIKLYSKGLSKGLFTTPEKQSEAAVNIGTKADEIESYLGKIIESLNTDFMSFEVNVTDFYLSDVIDRITVYYKDKLSVTGTSLSVADYSDCMISGDPDRLEEALQNVFENAIKYGDGRLVSLSFSEEEDCRLVTVSNTGCTLPEYELDHVFDSFWRGSNAGSNQGSGLGLYICQRLMHEMGGDIFAQIDNDMMRVTLVCRKCS